MKILDGCYDQRSSLDASTKYIEEAFQIFIFKTGFFFSLRLKNSRAQKLKLKNFLRKTQGFFVQKLKKSEILETILAEKSEFSTKMEVFDEIS